MKRNFLKVTVLMLAVLMILAACGNGNGNGAIEANDDNDANDNEVVVADAMRIGGIAPLTGGAAFFGMSARDGATLAFEQVNEAGGLLGQNVNFIVHDDEGAIPVSLAVYERLVYDDQVVAIVGPVTSGPANAVADRATEHALPMISPTATAEAVTRDRDFMFRACFLDAVQAYTIAYFAKNHLEADTAAILFNNAMDYSRGLAENFAIFFEEMGGTITSSLAYSTGDVDFRAQLTTIAATEPDVLFLPEYVNTVALKAVQAREADIEAILLGADGWEGVLGALDDPAILDGSFYSAHFAIDDPNPIVQYFVSSFTARFGAPPNSFSALGFDAASLMAQAIAAAGNTDSAAVIDAMQNIYFEGVTGSITFDEQGNPIKPTVIIAVDTIGGETAARLYHRFEADYFN